MTASCERAKEVMREGVREVDIDAELVAEGRRLGHQGFLRMRGFNQEMMSLYVTAGASGTIPSCADVPVSGLGVTHALAQGSSMKKVERGVPVMVDYGAGYNGYITDETRPFVVGELKESFRKPYEVAREIVEDTTAFGREGVNATEIFTRAYEIVKRAGLRTTSWDTAKDRSASSATASGSRSMSCPLSRRVTTGYFRKGWSLRLSRSSSFRVRGHRHRGGLHRAKGRDGEGDGHAYRRRVRVISSLLTPDSTLSAGSTPETHPG